MGEGMLYMQDQSNKRFCKGYSEYHLGPALGSYSRNHAKNTTTYAHVLFF